MATIKVLALKNFGYDGEPVDEGDVVSVDPEAMNIEEFVAAGFIEVVEQPKASKAAKATPSENDPATPPPAG